MTHERHGLFVGTQKQPRLYRIWRAMRFRCNNPGHINYDLYGGRGITVCEDWESYPTFEKWALSNGYTDDLSIDRINVNGNYEPSNCRWATIDEQSANKRRSKAELLARWRGKEMNLREWSAKTGIYYTTLHRRYMKGLRGDDLFAVPTPPMQRTGTRKK